MASCPSLLLFNNLANASTCFLSLCLSTDDLLDFPVDPRVSLLGLPGWWSIVAEHNFDFLNSFTASLVLISFPSSYYVEIVG